MFKKNSLIRPFIQNKFYLIILLISLFISILSIGPVIKEGLKGVFYTIDPDVMYVANALNFLRNGFISYLEHPGTPSIVLIALSFLPIKIASGFFHLNFFFLMMDNYALVFMYSRIFQTIIFFFSLCLFLTSIYLFNKSKLSVFFSVFSLLCFSQFYKLSSTISAETLGFFFVSVWLLLFSLQMQNRKRKYIEIILFITGLALANRITAIVLVPLAFFIDFAFLKSTPIVRLKNLASNSKYFLAGLILGLLPIIKRILITFKWIFRVVGSSQIYGTGEKTIFNWFDYRNSINSIFYQEKPLCYALLILVILFVIALVRLNKKSNKQILSLIGFIVSLVAFVAYAKFPLIRYQVTNYLLLVFFASTFFPWQNFKVKLLTIFILILLSLPVYRDYRGSIVSASEKEKNLEEFQKNNPPQKAAVWEWAKSKDFALIWSRGWGAGVFNDELKKERPDLLEIKSGFNNIRIDYFTEKPVFEVCWDQLYIQRIVLKEFLEKYNNHDFTVKEIVGSNNMVLVCSNHCLPTKL